MPDTNGCELDGKRALVCGGSRGIGRAAATELARRGAQVVLLARDAAALRAVRDVLPASGDRKHGTASGSPRRWPGRSPFWPRRGRRT